MGVSIEGVYHGCPMCFDQANDHPFYSERKMEDVYQETIRREERLRTLGFAVKSIWEHDYRALRETDEMQHFLDTFDIVTDLDPRDSFFGGRVGGYRLFCEAKANETIEYSDFCSLYPFVNKTKRYPVSHPTIIRDNFQPISNYFGLIKCEVLAPANLYHPVLPVRAKGKLSFVQAMCRGYLFRMPAFITDPLHFYKRIIGADTEMHDLCLLNDDLVEVVFKRKQEYAEESKATNLFIGIFTTAWARLELYNLLDLL